MRLSKNVLTNMIMDNQRKNPVYQTILTDLAITGAIDKNIAEMLLGYTIPNFLKTPNGDTVDKNNKDIKKEQVSQKQPLSAKPSTLTK